MLFERKHEHFRNMRKHTQNILNALSIKLYGFVSASTAIVEMFDFNPYCHTEQRSKLLSNENEVLLCYFPYFQAMYNTRIVYHGVLLLLAVVTSTDSTKCSRIIEGTTAPRSNAVGKYHFFLTLFNRTDIVYAYMPNTRYNGKHIYNRERGN